MPLYTVETERRPAARAVRDAAIYLDDVVIALADAGVRTSSIEIDARRPLTGRLVVADLDGRETVVLEWHHDTGWWMARRRRPNARPTGWLPLTGDPHAAAPDVAAQFRRDLLVRAY